MTTPEQMRDFENYLIVKNQLATLTLDELKEIQSDKVANRCFIEYAARLIKDEPGYFHLAPYTIDKLLELVELHRFDADYNDMHGIISDVISEANGLKCIDKAQREFIVRNYKLYHEKLRKFIFVDNEALLNSLMFDAISFRNITGLETVIISESMFIASINYFLDYMPGLFENDIIHSNTLIILESLSEGTAFYNLMSKKYIKNASKAVQKIKVKEE